MSKENPLFTYAKYSAIGLEFAVAAIVGVVGGNYIDSRFGTGPWGVFIGAILGLASGFYRLITVLKETSERREQNRREN
jgi:F0F1-type ATP synthase assembly protein I